MLQQVKSRYNVQRAVLEWKAGSFCLEKMVSDRGMLSQGIGTDVRTDCLNAVLFCLFDQKTVGAANIEPADAFSERGLSNAELVPP